LRASADAYYYWNSPTGYNETKRLPSPWVPIEEVSVHSEEGGKKDSSEIVFGDPSFRIKMVGPFEFKIVMDESLPKKATKYAVMDLQGRVMRHGDIRTTETKISELSAGSYIVKVGLGSRLVKLR
jgi:hypothetical protein